MTNQSNLELLRKIAAIDWDVFDKLNNEANTTDSVEEVKNNEVSKVQQDQPVDTGDSDRNDDTATPTDFLFGDNVEKQQAPTVEQEQQNLGILPKEEPKEPEVDNSASTLQDLLNQGYDLVKWHLGPEVSYDYKGQRVTYPCGDCLAQKGLMDAASKQIGYIDGYIPLDRFLETDFSTGSPIFDSTHPGCRCFLEVTKLDNPDDVRYVTKDGIK